MMIIILVSSSNNNDNKNKEKKEEMKSLVIEKYCKNWNELRYIYITIILIIEMISSDDDANYDKYGNIQQ